MKAREAPRLARSLTILAPIPAMSNFSTSRFVAGEFRDTYHESHLSLLPLSQLEVVPFSVDCEKVAQSEGDNRLAVLTGFSRPLYVRRIRAVSFLEKHLENESAP